MIKSKSVIVLGAGASKPYGFPTGKELKDNICLKFKTEWNEFVYKRTHTPFTHDYLTEQQLQAEKFVNDFKKFESDSIDLFLAINDEHSEIGKKAIYLNILKSETKSLRVGRINDWYSTLFKLMIGSIIRSEDYHQFAENNITIITFNYDRSLENYFFNAFMNYANSVDEKEKIKVLNKLEIHHVYGKLADLPWENESNSLEYGKELWMRDLDLRKDNIKTIYERRLNTKDLEPMIKSIQYADKIFYLGFGFAQENVEILKVKDHKRPDQLIYVSDFENRKERIETRMRGLEIWHENRTKIISMGDCNRVIDDYLF